MVAIVFLPDWLSQFVSLLGLSSINILWTLSERPYRSAFDHYLELTTEILLLTLVYFLPLHTDLQYQLGTEMQMRHFGEGYSTVLIGLCVTAWMINQFGSIVAIISIKYGQKVRECFYSTRKSVRIYAGKKTVRFDTSADVVIGHAAE